MSDKPTQPVGGETKRRQRGPLEGGLRTVEDMSSSDEEQLRGNDEKRIRSLDSDTSGTAQELLGMSPFAKNATASVPVLVDKVVALSSRHLQNLSGSASEPAGSSIK